MDCGNRCGFDWQEEAQVPEPGLHEAVRLS